MDPEKLLEKALDEGRKNLTEHESKQLLAAYGLPVAREVLAQSRQQALAAAADIGYPVAAKACGADIAHKSEKSLVRLHIADDAALEKAFRELAQSPGAQGVLISPMIAGNRELVLGLVRDSQFGPCVMAGIGGVLTEVINDTAFRMAPVNEGEALDMLDELNAKAILGQFRGQAPADRGALAACLEALGRIGMEHGAIKEIDVNPVILGPDGSITAVDALVVLEAQKAKP
ncbi:MAG: acetate--CoA ligase family protein [Desulfatibacillaceae bacterium]|nr:acetate--CoA ligase family protein [Desulfatibacillaceae bacterium]